MAQLVDQAILDDKQYLKSLNQMGKAVDKFTVDVKGRLHDAQGRFVAMGKAAGQAGNAIEQAGNRGSKGFGALGLQIGISAGFVQELTRRFLDLGKAATDALINMTQESIGLASNLETTEKIFTGIFQGNEDAAIGALARIRKESRGLGVDLGETARAFLPFVESLDQLSRTGKIAAALAIAQPEQGALGARISLQEALSGNVQSLVRRFEIPKTLGKELQRALDEGGVEAFLTTFEGILKKLGRDIDQLADTFQLSLGKTAITFEQLQTAFGIPITAELKQQLDDLNKVLEENFDDFEGLATLAGQVIAEILGAADVSQIGQFFADNKQDIAEFLTALREIVKSARELLDIDLGQAINVDTLTNAALAIDKIVNALIAIQSISASFESNPFLNGAFEGILAGLFPGLEAFIQIWNNLDKVIQAVIATYGLFVAVASAGGAALNNAYQEFLVLTGQIEENQKKLIDPQAEYQRVVAETNIALAEYRQNTAEAAQAVADTVIPTKEATDANEALADSLLKQQKAMDDLAQLESDFTEAQAKVNEKMAEAEKDFGRKMEDIDIATERKRLDIQIEFAQKREDAARKNLQKLDDIRRKNAQERADAAKDLERKEQDIAGKFAEERIDLERDQRQRRVDIETSFREKLQDIQREDEIDLEEAERKRDAVAFLRILRQQQEKVNQAQIDRQRDIDELRTTGERRKEELAIQQQRELEQAQLANERKLEDLRLNLNRQIEEQNIAYQRELEDIAINEQRKNEELARSREDDIEDAKRAYERKLEDLRMALEEELKIIEEFAARKAALEAQVNTPVTRRTPQRSSGGGNAPSIGPSSGTGNLDRPMRIPVFQRGGHIRARRPAIVGERGPELFVPQSSGRIIPNNQLALPSLFNRTPVNSISNIRGGATVNLPDVAGLINNPIAIRQIRNIVLQILGEVD